jgi:SAM-dependent methyltransferase
MSDRHVAALRTTRLHFLANDYERHRIRFLCRRVLPEVRGRVLDVGSNTGELISHAADRADLLVTSDADPFLARCAKINLERFGNNHTVILDLQQLPFAKNSFDTVTLLEVIEHLGKSSHQTCLDEAWRVTVPGGRIIASTPNQSSITAAEGRMAEALGRGTWNAWDESHLYLYSAREFLAALRVLPGAVVDARSFYFLPMAVVSRFPRVLRRAAAACSLAVSLYLSRWVPFRSLGFCLVATVQKSKLKSTI